MASPNIVLNIKWAAPYAPGAPTTKETKFRDWLTGGGEFNYTTRKEAVEKESIDELNAKQAIYQNCETDITDAEAALDDGFHSDFDYVNNRPGSTGAFDAEGDITPERADEIKQTLKTTKSTVWSAILSFEEDYGKQYCDSKVAAYAMMQEAFPALFKKSHLKFDNIEWYATLHRNTDNRHLHITFWEKEPMFLRKGDTEYHYSNVGKIKQEACIDFKFAVAKHLEIEALSSYKIRDSIRESLRHNINTSEKKDILTDLLSDVKASNSWRFGKQTAETRNKILQFALGVIDKDPQLKMQYDNYVNELLNQQSKYYKLCKENNIPVNDEIKTFADRNLHDLHGRLGNDVILCLKEFSKEYERIQRKYNSGNKRNENLKKLTSEDTALLEKIFSKPAANTFRALFEGKYTTTNREEGKDFYRTEEAATLAFAYRLIYYTQDKEQFQRILAASGVYTTTFDEQYNGQLNFTMTDEEIDAASSQTHKDVIFSITMGRFEKWTALPSYDNTNDISSLTKEDLSVIEKIKQNTLGADFEKTMCSRWENTQHDKDNELQGYHYHCFHLINLLSKFTQDKEQIERIAKSSPLYRPSIWDKEYSNQIPFIAASVPGTSYKDVLTTYCLERRKAWKNQEQGKKWSRKTSGNLILSRAHQSGRAIAGIVQNAFSMISTRFDNSFNQFRNAIKEQERRRKQAEGGTVYE